MTEPQLCPQCGQTVPADAPQGLCPACMMQAGLDSDASAFADRKTIAPQPPATDPDSPAPASAMTTDEFATLPPNTPRAKTLTEPASTGATLADIPGYEILGELGRGGMGVVYKARHIKLGRLVALKMILAGSHAGAADLARFRTEAEAIARVKHANIIQIYEVGEHEGKPYFALEYCDGSSLAQKTNGTPMQPMEAARMVELLANGMDAAHQQGIIHRDLKPANILLQIADFRLQIEKPDRRSEISNLQSAIPKITDFGLAKKLDDAGQTQSGAIMGTPSYMAPEQAGGKTNTLGPPADIYALGAILYELLTGRPPFKAATQLDTILQVVTDEPVPPSQLQNKMPRDVETICLKCLQKDPAKRYLSALALADDLRRYQNGEAIQARPVGSAERVVKWVKRRPMVAGLIAAVVSVAFIGITGISGGLGWALIERDHALGQEKKAQNEKTLAEIARQEAETATKEMKKQLLRAETLVVQVKFDHAYYQPEENLAFTMLATAGVLREPIVLENRPLRDSLGLHLGSWIGQVHRLKAMHSHEFTVVAFSPDRKTVLTGTGDFTEKRGEGRLWETATGKPLGPPLLHQGEVTAVAFSADGKTVVTGSRDKTARLWETATGKPVGPPLQHQDNVVAVGFSPDGNTVQTGSWDMTARLWETRTGKQLGPSLQHQPNVVNRVVFSPDGETVLTLGGGDRTVRLWERATGKPLEPALQDQGTAWAAVFSPDSRTVLTASGDTARLWETATRKPLGPPMQHQGTVIAAVFSPDGKTVLTGSFDKTARLWDAATGKQLGPYLQHQSVVDSVTFSPDGKTVLTGSHDKTARLWETSTGKPLGPPLQHQEAVWSVAVSPDGKTVLTWSGHTLRLWEMAAANPFGPPLQHQGEVLTVAFSSDGKAVLTGSTDKAARLWETATGKQLGPPLQHQHTVMTAAFSPNGKTVLTGSADTTAQLWVMGTGKPLGPPLQHQHTVFAVAFSPDGKTVLTGSFDRTARLWETATGEPLGPPLEHLGHVMAAVFSPDGKTVLTGSGSDNEGTARLWETATGKPLGTPLPHQNFVSAVAFSPDGKTVLTVSDKTVRLWKATTGKPVGTPLQHPGYVQAVAVSPDGNTILTTSGNTGWLWETATGKPLGPVLPHQGQVVAVTFSPDGKTVLTGSMDNSAQLWETATGKPVGPPLQHQGGIRTLAVSPDGRTVLTGSDDKTARLWRVPRPIQGDPERILLWTQIITGMELDEQAQVRILDANTWQERRQQLEKLGGPPLP